MFFDNILVYSPTLHDHVTLLEMVLQILRDNHFFVKFSKCAFVVSCVEYLSHFITNGIVNDSKKIQAVVEWPIPKTIKQLHGFLGLAGYYRHFIKFYGPLATPLTPLMKKNAFKWDEEATKAFEILKTALKATPVLPLPDFNKQFVDESDAYGVGIGVVLMQDDQPLAFISKALAPRHQHLPVYEKELMAVVLGVLQWRQYLENKIAKLEVLAWAAT